MLFQAGGFVFQDALRYLQYIGVWDVILPFALIFAIIFAVLDKTKIFEHNNINIVIALSISLLSIIPHVMGGYPPGLDVVLIINAFFPQIALALIAIVMVLIMTGLMIKDSDDFKFTETLGKWAAGISIALVLFFMYNSINPVNTRYGSTFNFLNDPQLQAFVISALVFGLIVWFIQRGLGGGNGVKKKKKSTLENALAERG